MSDSSPIRPTWSSVWWWRSRPVAAAVVVAAAIVAHLPSLSNGLVLDDRAILLQHEVITGRAPWRRVWNAPYWPPQRSLDPLYRPVTIASLRLSYALFGATPAGHHAVNVGLHAAASLMVALLAARIWRRTSCALTAGVLFAVHPLNVEAVTTVVGRAELLAALFVFLLLYRHLGHAAAGGAPSARYHIGTALLFGLAIGSKEHAVVALAGLVLIDYQALASCLRTGVRSGAMNRAATGEVNRAATVRERTGPRRRSGADARFLTGAALIRLVTHVLRACMKSRVRTRLGRAKLLLSPGAGTARGSAGASPSLLKHSLGTGATARTLLSRLAASHYLGLIVICAAYLLLRWNVFGARMTLDAAWVDAFSNPLAGATWTHTLSAAAVLFLLGLRLVCWPPALCPVWAVGGIPLPQSLGRIDVVVGLVLFVILIALAAVAVRRRWPSAVPLVCALLGLLIPCHWIPLANWLFAERWLYLPFAFAAVLASGVVIRPDRFVWPNAVGGGVVLVLLVGNTWRYESLWKNNLIMLTAVVERQPGSHFGLAGLTSELDHADRLPEAAPYIERLTEAFPESPHGWFYRAKLRFRQGDLPGARRALDRYAELRAPSPLGPQMREIDRATAHLRE